MSLSDAIASLGASSYVITRRTSGGYTEGRRNPPVVSTITIMALVQPLTGRELERLPEGMQHREVRAVWTAADLKSGDDTFEPDAITIDGSLWEVQNVESWSALAGYRKCLVAKE